MAQDTNIQVTVTTQTPSPLQRGVITIDQAVIAQVPQLRFLLGLEQTTTQGDLKKDGAFDVVHHILLLPESYTIIAIFFDVLLGCWKILVESESIPVTEWGATKLPEIELQYALIHDETTGINTPFLVNIQALYRCRTFSLSEILDPRLIKDWKGYITVKLEEKGEQ